MGRDQYLRERNNVGRSAQVQFILTGFTQDLGFRVFAFERIGDDRIRTKCTVRADLALIRGYGIRIQELPLLCRGLLDHGDSGGCEMQSLTFGEAEMRACADERTAAHAAAVARKKPPHRPVGENLGVGWRVQHS